MQHPSSAVGPRAKEVLGACAVNAGMEEDAPAQGGKQASRPSKETAVMFRVPEEDGGLPGQQNASPGGYPSQISEHKSVYGQNLRHTQQEPAVTRLSICCNAQA